MTDKTRVGCGAATNVHELVCHIQGRWPGENALYFVGKEQYLSRVSRGKERTRRKVELTESLHWIALWLRMGREVEWGFAAERWVLYVAGYTWVEREYPIPDTKGIYSLAEAAEILNCSVRTLKRLIKARRIGASRIGRGHYLIFQTELRSFIYGRRTRHMAFF